MEVFIISVIRGEFHAGQVKAARRQTSVEAVKGISRAALYPRYRSNAKLFARIKENTRLRYHQGVF
jgi:hypothetical protein